MKTNRKMRSIGIFALVFVLLTSVVLPLAAAGSGNDYMGTYTVKKGDTLSSIAASHGVTVASIVEENGISASSTLKVGQQLLIAGATSVEDDSTTVYGSSSRISIDFGADSDLIGVLETILAHTGYHVIFKGQTTNVPAIALENVTPLTAIDYVLRMVDMTYIKNDNLLYIGTAEVLNSNFIDSKALTSFKLKYISSEELMNQLSTLGISVKVVKSDLNIREFWVSGYPMELAKMRELIDILDNKTNMTVGSSKISTSLNAIELKYITASQFSGLLSELGLHSGIVMEFHPMTLFVYASGDAYKDIINIKKLVDYYDPNATQGTATDGESTDSEGTSSNETDKPSTDNSQGTTGGTTGGTTSDSTTGDVVITDGETSLVKVDLTYINKATATEIISNFGYDVEVLGIEVVEKSIWLRGEADEVNDAVERIKENDIAANNTDKTFFTYELQNIVASELQSKIAYVDTDGVDFYFGSYPQFTKSIMVYCPTNKEAQIKELIAELDNNLQKMYYPIDSLTTQDEYDTVEAKLELVITLLNNPNITRATFDISDNLLAGASNGPTTGEGEGEGEGTGTGTEEAEVKYVLYVYESSENIDAIINMWNKIG